MIETVQSHGVNVSAIVINHVIRECPCQFCQEKMASQSSHIQDIRNRCQDKRIVILPDYGGEIKGEGLKRVAEDLYARGEMEL